MKSMNIKARFLDKETLQMSDVMQVTKTTEGDYCADTMANAAYDADTGRLIFMDTQLGFPYFLSRFRAHFPDKYGGRVDMAVHIAPHLPPFFKDFSDGWGEFMRRNDTLGQGLSLGR